ncbi:hypothetical protein PGB90_005905 [Kerria lacca]
MSEWTVQQHAFAVERFFRNNDSYTLTVRDFQRVQINTKSSRFYDKNFKCLG